MRAAYHQGTAQWAQGPRLTVQPASLAIVEHRPIISSMADFEAQQRAIAEGVLVRPMPELSTLVVSGSERQSWLAGMLTADLAPLRSGQGAYALAVNKNGRIQAEVWVA